MVMEIIIQVVTQVMPLAIAVTLFLLGAVGLRLYNRGEVLEEYYPGVCTKLLRFMSKWFYRVLILSVLVILLLGYRDVNFFSIFYFSLLPWIVFTRIKTWKDQSSLLEYRFIKNNFLRYLLIAIPLQVFSILSIIELILAAIL